MFFRGKAYILLQNPSIIKSKHGQRGLQTTTQAAVPCFGITERLKQSILQASAKQAPPKRCSSSHPVTFCFMKHLLFYGNSGDYMDLRSISANYTATREQQPPLPVARTRLVFSHQHLKDTLLLSQHVLPAPVQTFGATSCWSLTYTSKVKGTFA